MGKVLEESAEGTLTRWREEVLKGRLVMFGEAVRLSPESVS